MSWYTLKVSITKGALRFAGKAQAFSLEEATKAARGYYAMTMNHDSRIIAARAV